MGHEDHLRLPVGRGARCRLHLRPNTRPGRHDRAHIGLCFGNLRHLPTTLDPPWTGIVCGKRQIVAAKAIDLLLEITRAAPDVVAQAVGIDPSCLAVPGINCARPNAPLGDTAAA